MEDVVEAVGADDGDHQTGDDDVGEDGYHEL